MIYSHAAVLESAVIGVTDVQWGEAVKAVAVVKPGTRLEREEYINFLKQRLAAYKVPKSVEFCDSLPHTKIGKVNKVRLREMTLSETSAAEQRQT